MSRPGPSTAYHILDSFVLPPVKKYQERLAAISLRLGLVVEALDNFKSILQSVSPAWGLVDGWEALP